MPRRRFFIPRDRIQDGIAVLTPDQAHHLRAVLRLRAGEEVELFDGEGRSFSGTIEYRGTEIHIGALEKLDLQGEGSGSFVLAPALIKFDRFEWILQKGTELGVDEFIPLETRFAAVHIPASRREARFERWQRIVTEASKQSRRLTVPKIHTSLRWEAFLASAEYAACARFMLYEKAEERIRTAPPGLDRVLLCVGPEGGWEASEARAAEQAGFRLINLGSRILRAETASLAAISIFQFLLQRGDV
jgi:16S rRNA (uracil1498-N3)-methyltransferase